MFKEIKCLLKNMYKCIGMLKRTLNFGITKIGSNELCKFAETIREPTAPGLDSMHAWKPKILPRHHHITLLIF
jgi:hypothetical protein